MAPETSGIRVYSKITLVDNRTTAQIQVVAPGDPSNGRTPGEAGDLLDFPLDFLYRGKGNSSITSSLPADGSGHRTVLPLEGSPGATTWI